MFFHRFSFLLVLKIYISTTSPFSWFSIAHLSGVSPAVLRRTPRGTRTTIWEPLLSRIPDVMSQTRRTRREKSYRGSRTRQVVRGTEPCGPRGPGGARVHQRGWNKSFWFTGLLRTEQFRLGLMQRAVRAIGKGGRRGKRAIRLDEGLTLCRRGWSAGWCLACRASAAERRKEGKHVSGASLKALSHVGMSGNCETCVFQRD